MKVKETYKMINYWHDLVIWKSFHFFNFSHKMLVIKFRRVVKMPPIVRHDLWENGCRWQKSDISNPHADKPVLPHFLASFSVRFFSKVFPVPTSACPNKARWTDNTPLSPPTPLPHPPPPKNSVQFCPRVFYFWYILPPREIFPRILCSPNVRPFDSPISGLTPICRIKIHN